MKFRTLSPGLFLTLLVAVFLTGCDSFLLEEQFSAVDDSSESAGPLAISPSVVSVRHGDVVVFSGSGGVSPYTFSLEHDDLGAIDATTGEFTAGNSNTDGVVWVTDGDGSSAGALVYVNSSSGETLSLGVSDVEIDRDQTVRLYPSGGTAPYSLSIPNTPSGENSHTDVYPNPAADGQRGSIHNNDTYVPGDYIGSVWVRVTDSKGAVAEEKIKVVPEAPQDFVATGFGPPNNKVELTWEYQKQGVRFIIRKSEDGEVYSEVDDFPSETRSYEDSPVDNNKPYWYEVYAFADGDSTYRSSTVTAFVFVTEE
jgi:hypothetical protein